MEDLGLIQQELCAWICWLIVHPRAGTMGSNSLFHIQSTLVTPRCYSSGGYGIYNGHRRERVSFFKHCTFWKRSMMMMMYIHRWKKRMHFCLDENLTCQVHQQPLFHFSREISPTHTYMEKKMIIKLGSKFNKFKRLVLTATARWKTMWESSGLLTKFQR